MSTGDFKTLLNFGADEEDRALSAVRIVRAVLHVLSPEDLADSLLQANTKAKRTFLIDRGLPMRKAPDAQLATRLIEEMQEGDSSVLVEVSSLVHSSFARRLDQFADGLSREEFPDDPLGLVDHAEETFGACP